MEQAEIGEVREFNGKKYVACEEEEEGECIGCAFYDSVCWAGDPLMGVGPCNEKPLQQRIYKLEAMIMELDPADCTHYGADGYGRVM